jgi:hypothetical protein
MQTSDAPRVSIRVSPFLDRPATAGWTPRRLVLAVFVCWGAVAAIVGAVILALAWDLRP